MRLARVSIAVIGLAACDAADSESTGADRPAVVDTTALVVVDRPTVIGYFPLVADATEAEEDGYSEGMAHVAFALHDAEECLGPDLSRVVLVVDTAVRLQYRGHTDTLRFPRVDSLSFGAYLIAPGRPPRLVNVPWPSALIPAVGEAIPEYFRRPCAGR